MSKVVERFIRYVKFDTQSNPESNTVPTTEKQLLLAKTITEELKQIGLKDIINDEKGYVYATLPSNTDKSIPTIGFIAHMDTSPDLSGANVNPQIIENYNGEDVVLNKEQNILLSTSDFPEMKEYIGETLITTDGTTLLGADNKAGIAEIITAMEYLINHPEIPHGTIKVGFTPDEEVGRGANYFDVKGFNADFAYTIDGGPIGELEYENFNAASAKVVIKGRNVHPGTAKGKMINSTLIANEFISLMPENQSPADTEGYEGFYHLNSLKGNVEETILQYIIRDFDKTSFEKRKQTIQGVADNLNDKYRKNMVSVEMKDQYFNMKEKIEPVMHIIDTAFKAMEEVGVKPIVKPIRGGTDGARLSYKGLPTPNIFTGGHNFHGRYEFIPTESMGKAVKVIIKIVELYAKK